jgi:hypothetical protein
MLDSVWPADHVERWPLSRLTPYAHNARTHPDAQVAQMLLPSANGVGRCRCWWTKTAPSSRAMVGYSQHSTWRSPRCR